MRANSVVGWVRGDIHGQTPGRGTRLARGATRGIRWALAAAAALAGPLCASGAQAEDLSYSGVDRATVRVLALGPAKVVPVEHRGVVYQIGVPLGGHGSGVLVKENGLVLTAAHVVENARLLAVHLPGKREPVPAKVLYVNDAEDYAFIRIAGTYSEIAHFAAPDEQLKVRSTIFAIGYPLDATRFDPQSSKGSISGKRPDGRLQLDIQVNPGNSGGPVIDEKEQVQAIVVARSDVEKGQVGLAAAVPVSSFRSKYEELAQATPDTSDIDTEAAQRVANMVSTLAQDGLEWFKGSLESSESQNDINSRVRKQAEDMPASSDAQIMAAVYFWNRYMVRLARGQEGQELHSRATQYVERAVKLEPGLKESSDFVEFVLGEGREERAPQHIGPRPRHHEGFFLRAGYGLGYLSSSLEQNGGESLSGLLKQWEVLIGGGGRGMFWGAAFSNASGDVDYEHKDGNGNTLKSTTHASVFRFGPFWQYFPSVTGGLNFRLQASIMGADASGASLNGGFAASAGAGYDLWFSSAFNAGLNVGIAYLSGSQNSGWLPTATLSLGLR
ncbi:MAG TPA: serine protease [Polyangiaceae bacterium]|nr:serine protease [Polyangiaceae bacterium]